MPHLHDSFPVEVARDVFIALHMCQGHLAFLQSSCYAERLSTKQLLALAHMFRKFTNMYPRFAFFDGFKGK